MPSASDSSRSAALAVAPVEVGAGHDHRPLGRAPAARRPARSRAPSARRQRRRVRQRGAGSRVVGLHEDDVERQVEEGRAGRRRRASRRAPRRPAPGSRRSTVAVRALFVSGATNGTWSISCSEPWPQRICGARPPSTSIGELFLCADAIALMPFVTPGPGGQRADARLARDLRPALGRERGRRLVAHVDQVDALRAAAVVDGEEVAAREREQLGRRRAPSAAARRSSPPCGCFVLGRPARSRCLGLVLRRHRCLLGRLPRTLPRLRVRSVSGSLPTRAAVLAGGAEQPAWALRRRPLELGGRAADRASARRARAPPGSRRSWSRSAARALPRARRAGLARAATSPSHPLPASSTALERAGGRPVLVCGVRHAVRDAGAGRAPRRERDEPLVVPSAGGRLHPLLGALRPCAARRRCARRSNERAPLHEVVARARRRDRLDEQELRALRRPGAAALQRQHARRPGARGGDARARARALGRRGGGGRSGPCGTPGPRAAR